MRPIDADELIDILNKEQDKLDEYYLGLQKAKRIVADMNTLSGTTYTLNTTGSFSKPATYLTSIIIPSLTSRVNTQDNVAIDLNTSKLSNKKMFSLWMRGKK